MRLVIMVLVVLMVSALVPTTSDAEPLTAANCRFVLGFKTLHDAIPETVGDCKVNEHYNIANGDALQETTGGLLVWRKADNFTAFTDGYRTWVNGPYGVQQRLNTERLEWEGNPLQVDPSLGTRCENVSNQIVSNAEDYSGQVMADRPQTQKLIADTCRTIASVDGEIGVSCFLVGADGYLYAIAYQGADSETAGKEQNRLYSLCKQNGGTLPASQVNRLPAPPRALTPMPAPPPAQAPAPQTVPCAALPYIVPKGWTEQFDKALEDLAAGRPAKFPPAPTLPADVVQNCTGSAPAPTGAYNGVRANLTRVDQDWYKDTLSGGFVHTFACYEYVYYQDALLFSDRVIFLTPRASTCQLALR